MNVSSQPDYSRNWLAMAAVSMGVFLGTIDGSIMSVRVSDMGTEQVTTRRGPVATHHYRLSGDLNRDLWYDAQGNLAHVSFTAEDGTTVTYVRK